MKILTARTTNLFPVLLKRIPDTHSQIGETTSSPETEQQTFFYENANEQLSIDQTIIFTVCNVVAARLCFHWCLSFCSRGCVCVWQTPAPSACWDTPPSACWDTYPRLVHAGIQPSPSRRPLQRTVRILLECILLNSIS